LLFPAVFKQLRKSRRLLQKVVALDLGMDPSVLCGVEGGTRPPPELALLQQAALLFQLTAAESQQLLWAAHHDRLIGCLGQRGASDEEMELFSTGLSTMRHLSQIQVQGLLASLNKISKSATLLSSLSSNESKEVVMT